MKSLWQIILKAVTLHSENYRVDMTSSTIIIADNQAIARLGLRYLITTTTTDTVVHDAATERELISLLDENKDALVIVDPANFLNHFTDDTLRLAETYNKAHWIVFSNDIPDIALNRFSANQRISMVEKNCIEGELSSSVVLALSHQRFICQRLMNLLLNPNRQKDDPLAELTETEREILRLTAQGKTVKEIATERFSSTHTVTTHKRNIFHKLKINTSYEATMVAVRAGLVDIVEYYI